MKTNSLEEWISKDYLRDESIHSQKKSFSSAKPFFHLELKNFLTENLAKKLLLALSKETFTQKEADLFKLKQTNDLSSSKIKALSEFRNFLLSEGFMHYMESITGLALKRGIVDLSGSMYEDTDFLLCHDDRLEGRKIAFLFYLSSLNEKDGGALALLDKKLGAGKRIIPQFNTFAFFEVSKISHHEVEEVIAQKQRIALGGWFHA